MAWRRRRRGGLARLIATARRLDRALAGRVRAAAPEGAAAEALARLETALGAARLSARQLARRAGPSEIETVTEARSDVDWRQAATERPAVSEAEPEEDPPLWSEY